jgi:hypothetical protein
MVVKWSIKVGRLEYGIAMAVFLARLAGLIWYMSR